jgi:hypothetical protein
MGAIRSFEKLSKLGTGEVPNLSKLKRYSAKYDWVKRAQAYDDYLQKKTLQALEKRILKFKDQRSKEALEIANKAFESMQSDNIGSKEARKRWELGVDKFMQILGLDRKDVKIEHDGEIKITINPKVEP